MAQVDVSRPTEIALGNTLRIRFLAAQVGGIVNEGLSLRGFLSDSPTGAPLDPSVVAVAVPVGDGSGDYDAVIPGDAITAILAPFLHTTVWILGESVPVGSYRDQFPVRVVEGQGLG